MKKIFALVLVLSVCLSLCACGKSKAVKETEKAIDSIGEVSLSSADAIKNAEKLLSVLTDSEKENVDNRLTLVEAREAYDKLASEIIRQKAKASYEKLTEAADIAVTGVEDIYSGANAGVQGARSSSLTMMYYMKNSTSLDNLELSDAYFALMKQGNADDSAASGVAVVLLAYDARGTFTQLDYLLNEGLTIVQELTSNYSDETYATKLQEYYTAISVCSDFFKNPTGTFSELESTVKAYKNNISTIQTSLGLLFI